MNEKIHLHSQAVSFLDQLNKRSIIDQHRAGQVRKHFLDFFAKQSHQIVTSASLIPSNDPTLMFTNAGMVPFKDVFVGLEKLKFKRAATAQKCLRVSGKHNDLEEVGRTTRHHTFFEMLGNFSFGDYFKEEAIQMAWQFITREIALNPDRLWITVFKGSSDFPADDEAAVLWRKISGLSDNKILRLGAKDNFWAMGETGPCGPCTEIHYDLGGDTPVGPADFESGRVIEIWNNVFMQFERKSDTNVQPLPRPSVDTGMGLERLLMVMQGTHSNYHTDLFTPLLQAVSTRIQKPYCGSDSPDDISMRVIVDHARAAAFLVADGLQPGNDGRAYVMRRIMRRAICHGQRLGFEQIFFDQICDTVVEIMEAAYPELQNARSLIQKIVSNEEKTFRHTLDTGLKILETEIECCKQKQRSILDGKQVFRLYDTYGFPKDLTEVIAKEKDFSIDHQGFDKQMQAQKTRSRGSDLGGVAIADIYKELLQKIGSTTFIGYPTIDEMGTRPNDTYRIEKIQNQDYILVPTQVQALIQEQQSLTKIQNADAFEVILNPTPFYGESGGQVGDSGILVMESKAICSIIDNQKPVENLTVSFGKKLNTNLEVGQKLWAGYPITKREMIRVHHSATHLLHLALREVLGSHVKQSGSKVDAGHLRFDYAHFEAPTFRELRLIEDRVIQLIQAKHPIQTEILPIEEAQKKGAVALFGEKYGSTVRVVSMGSSLEFCGGTHVQNTSDIDVFLITKDEAIASGVRRIEAVAGKSANTHVHNILVKLQAILDHLSYDTNSQADEIDSQTRSIFAAIDQFRDLRNSLNSQGLSTNDAPINKPKELPKKTSRDYQQIKALRDTWEGLNLLINSKSSDIQGRLKQLQSFDNYHFLHFFAEMLTTTREYERQLSQRERSKLSDQIERLLASTKRYNSVQVLTARIDQVAANALKDLADQLRVKLKSGIVALGGKHNDKATLIIALTKDLSSRFNAGSFIKNLAPIIGGRGGGKKEMAQAGGAKPEALEQLFQKLHEIVEKT